MADINNSLIDFKSLFNQALKYVTSGISVKGAMKKACLELYPSTYKEMNSIISKMLGRMMSYKNVGELMALRLLAENEKYIKRLSPEIVRKSSSEANDEEDRKPDDENRPKTNANYREVLRLTLAKYDSGMTAEKSAESAAREMYPYTWRGVYDGIFYYIKRAAHEEKLTTENALVELVMDTNLLDRLLIE